MVVVAGKPVIVAVGGGLPGPGYTFIADESVAADAWKLLTDQVGCGACQLIPKHVLDDNTCLTNLQASCR